MSEKQTLRQNATSGQPSQGNHVNECHGHTNLRHANLVNRNSHNPMKTLTKFLTLVFATTHALLGIAAEETPAAAQGKSPGAETGLTSVFLIDDQTGPELEAKHGIKQLAVTDLEVLVNGVMQNRKPVRLFAQVVDEFADDNETAILDFQPFAGGEPPKARFDNLPLRELESASEKYRKDRNAWLWTIREYRTFLQTKAEAFVRSVTQLQTSVSEKFDAMLSKRNGADFHRSDVAGVVLSANKALGNCGLRIIVVNSDCEDLPMNGHSRHKPFDAAELDPNVALIFVNTSRLPEVSPMFKGVKNPVHHAENLKEAMELVLKTTTDASTEKIAVTKIVTQ